MGHKIGQIFFSEKPPLPGSERWNDMRQKSQRIIGGKQRETDQISKDSQHEEVIKMPPLFLHLQVHLVEHHPVHHFLNDFQEAS